MTLLHPKPRFGYDPATGMIFDYLTNRDIPVAPGPYTAPDGTWDLMKVQAAIVNGSELSAAHLAVKAIPVHAPVNQVMAASGNAPQPQPAKPPLVPTKPPIQGAPVARLPAGPTGPIGPTGPVVPVGTGLSVAQLTALNLSPLQQAALGITTVQMKSTGVPPAQVKGWALDPARADALKLTPAQRPILMP
jgi:hypothetical protein